MNAVITSRSGIKAEQAVQVRDTALVGTAVRHHLYGGLPKAFCASGVP
jgi:hypothetical protein